MSIKSIGPLEGHDPAHQIDTMRDHAQNIRQQKKTAGAPNFQDLLRQAQEQQQPQLKLSKHVQERIQRRDISLSDVELKQLNQAADTAASKGIRDSLIFNGDTAYIVNIPSRTVITAINNASGDKQVFTNIDGAVIL